MASSQAGRESNDCGGQDYGNPFPERLKKTQNEKQKEPVSGLTKWLLGVSKEVVGFHDLLMHPPLFGGDILRGFLQRVSLAKPTSAPLRF
jgi:hypothetical protein